LRFLRGLGTAETRAAAPWFPVAVCASPRGASGTLSADLAPGDYELVCHMPGHYAAGQKLPFKVE